MELPTARTASRFISRNFVSFIFPFVSFSLIYLDYSHTQKWKKDKLKNN